MCSIKDAALFVGVAGVGAASFGTSAQAGTSFSFWHHGYDADWSYIQEKDGLTLELSATANGHSALVFKSYLGAGVYSGRHDRPQVDGIGKHEILWLDFSQPVRLDKVYFTLVDYRGDEVMFVDANGDPIGEAALSPYENYFGGKTLKLAEEGLEIVGTRVGITTTDRHDDFKVKYVHATVVPIAPAGLLAGGGMLTLGGLCAARRRRGADQADQA